jgi:hypothetical protein
MSTGEGQLMPRTSQQLLNYLDEIDPLQAISKSDGGEEVPNGSPSKTWAWEEGESADESKGDEGKDGDFGGIRAPPAADSMFWRERDREREQREARVANMKLLLKEKRSEVSALKKALEDLRKGNAARAAKRAAKEDARRAKEEEEWQAGLERQHAFSKQLGADVGSLRDKCDDLDSKLELLRRTRGQDVQSARAEASRRLRAQRELWSAAERARLEKLAEGKKASMQDGAIRALEPELQKLVQSHNVEIQKRISAYEAAEESLKASVSAKMAERMSRELVRARSDAERELEHCRSEGSRSCRQAQIDGEKEIAAVRDALRRAMESDRVSYEARLARQREGAAVRLESARSLTLSTLREEEAAAAAEAAEEEKITSLALARLVDSLEEETRCAEQAAASAGQKEAQAQARAAVEEARQKADTEADMVVKKLCAEAAAQRDTLESECRGKLEAAQRAGSLRLETLRREESEAMRRYMDATAEQTQLSADIKEAELTEASEAKLLREVVATLAALQRCADEKDAPSGHELSELERKKSSELASALRAVEELEERTAAFEAAAQEEEQSLEAKRVNLVKEWQAEDEGARAKIKAVLGRRRAQREDLRARLAKLQASTLQKHEQVSELRAKHFS